MSALVLQCLSMVLLAAALGLLTYAVLRAPAPPPSYLGLRGYKRLQALREQAAFRMVAPPMAVVSRRLFGLMPDAVWRQLDRQLVLAGELAGLSPEDVAALSLFAGAFGGAAGALCGRDPQSAALLGLMLGAAGLTLPYLYLSGAAQERQRRIALRTPHAVDLLTLGLGAGLDFPAAVRQLVDRSGNRHDPLYEELRLVLQDLHLGRTRAAAIAELYRRVPCEPIRELVSAVRQAEAQGTPLAEVLKIQAKMARMRRSARAEEAASRAATQMLFPLVLLFLCVLLLIMGPMVIQLSEQFS